MIRTLEQFLELECGIVSDSLIETFEPHRKFVEDSLTRYWKNPVSNWDIFVDLLWAYLPEVTDEHFTP